MFGGRYGLIFQGGSLVQVDARMIRAGRRGGVGGEKFLPTFLERDRFLSR